MNTANNLIWVCRQCTWAADIEIFPARTKEMQELRGNKYLCRSCGIAGYMSDTDAPIQVTETQADIYWLELQTDKLFAP